MRAQEGAALRICLLGRFAVHAGDRTVVDRDWPHRKARTLVKLLAAAPTHALHREQVLDALWPRLEPRAAMNNLHKNLHYLRVAAAAAGVASPIVSDVDALSLAPGVVVDLDELRETAVSARAAQDAALYERALVMCEDEPLPDDVYEQWAADARERVHRLRPELLRELADLYDGAGHLPQALALTEQLAGIDPADEEAHRALMRRYACSGRVAQALRTYARLKEVLAREFEVAPS